MRRTGGNGILWACVRWWLVGAAITVAIAWGLSVWEGSRPSATPDRGYDISANTFVAPFPRGRPDHWPDDPRPSVFEVSEWWIRCRVWVSGYPAPDEHTQAMSRTSRVQAWEVGFPLRAMSWEVWSREAWDGTYVPVARSRWVEGVAIGTRTMFGAALPRVPLRVEWGAFAADAAVWGGALWLVSGGVRRWRRAWRMERGRCARCGYDRAGLAPGGACPECGNPA